MLENTPRRGSETRERILEIAEGAVLAKGFAATSIDELIAAVGITKSGFFYHFKDKGELAKAMLLRYLERDKALLDNLFSRADELNEDPLHGFLVGMKLFAEMMSNLPEVHHNRGSAHYELGHYEEAIACYDRALALKPDYVQALPPAFTLSSRPKIAVIYAVGTIASGEGESLVSLLPSSSSRRSPGCRPLPSACPTGRR